MKKLTLLFIYFTLSTPILSQSKIDDQTSAIVTEGKQLYRSELASWYGTDLFFEKLNDKKAKVAGYFSYSEKSISKCVFFSTDATPKVLATISFDSTYNTQTALVDGTERAFSNSEADLYSIRKQALAEINSDTIFKSYTNTSLNLIPIISGSEKKVYVLTGPEKAGVVILGNDYLLTFNKQNQLLSKKRLHKNIIQINYAKTPEEKVVTMHTHLPETGDFITATDICTLMLYEKFANWEQHIVMSENYVNIWDCHKDILAVLTKEAWDNINKARNERKKN